MNNLYAEYKKNLSWLKFIKGETMEKYLLNHCYKCGEVQKHGVWQKLTKDLLLSLKDREIILHRKRCPKCAEQ